MGNQYFGKKNMHATIKTCHGLQLMLSRAWFCHDSYMITQPIDNLNQATHNYNKGNVSFMPRTSPNQFRGKGYW
jgi:hypothetical protein